MEVTPSSVGWDERARRLAAEARQYAFLFGADAVGPDHLLAAAAAVAPAEGPAGGQVTRDRVLAVLARIAGPPTADPAEGRPRHLTPQARAAVAHAIAAAGRAGRAVECRDLWAGLLADPDGLAWIILAELGVNPGPAS